MVRSWPGRFRCGLIVCAVAGALLAAVLLPLEQWAEGLRGVLGGSGAWGPLVVVLVKMVWGLVLPTVPVQFLAAGLYGVWPGLLIAYGGTTAAMLLTLILGRCCLRRSLRAYCVRWPVLGRVERALALEGWRAVALLRCSNAVPGHVVNWALSLSSLSIPLILVVSVVAKAPGMMLAAALGHAGLGGSAAWSHPGTWFALLLGVGATIAALVLLGRRCRVLLHTEALGESGVAGVDCYGGGVVDIRPNREGVQGV